METEAGRSARETLDLAFQISNILETGLDRHTLSILIALCDRGLNPEALAALIREFASPPAPNPTLQNPNSSASSPAAAPKDLSALSRLHLQP